MKRKLFGTIGVTAGLIVATLLLTQTPSQAASSEHSTRQVAQLYELQAAFHQAASGGGHLSDMLGLWTNDGSLTVLATGHTYAGKGVPGTPSCAPGSNTLCDFFSHVAGPFQPGHDWISLSPAFKTRFTVHGNTADVYFECHYFDVNNEVLQARVTFQNGKAEKVHGQWLLSHGDAGTVSVPLST
jgi:hypothetical protein